MRKQIKLLMLLLFISVTTIAQTYEKTDIGIVANTPSMGVEIQFYTPSTVRIIKHPNHTTFSKESYSVISQPEKVKLSTQQNGNIVRIQSKALIVDLDLETGVFSFFDKKSNPLLIEASPASFLAVDDAGNKTFKVKQTFALEQDEAIYGLGNLENGRLSQRGEDRTLMP